VSRDVLPLDEAERAAVRELQLRWGMVKRCARCDRLLPVARFRPAAATCEECRPDQDARPPEPAGADLEAWWSAQKSRLGRAS
jgi:hypothetical protein